MNAFHLKHLIVYVESLHFNCGKQIVSSGGLTHIVDKTFGKKSRCLRVCFVQVCRSHLSLELEILDKEGVLGLLSFFMSEPRSLEQFTVERISLLHVIFFSICSLIIGCLQHEIPPSLDDRNSNGLNVLIQNRARHTEYI